MDVRVAQVFDEVHVDEDDMFSGLAISAAGDSLWASCRVRALISSVSHRQSNAVALTAAVLLCPPLQSGELVRIDPRAYGTGAKASVYQLHERKVGSGGGNP